MAEKTSWFTKGKEGRKKAKQENEAAKARRNNDPWRIRLKNDESGVRVVLIDNPDFFLREHTLKLGPKKYINETCIQEYDNCAPCDHMGDMPSYEVVCTVIDTRKWETKDGKEVKNQKKLLVAKGKARDNLLRRVDQNDGDLKYCVLELARGSNLNECGTGEDIVFLKRLTVKQVMSLMPQDEKEKDKWLEPFEYEKVFAPKTAEELRKLYGGSAIGAEDDLTGTDDEDLSGDLDAMVGDSSVEKEAGEDDAGEEGEESVSEFDEDGIRGELELKNRKGLELFIKTEKLEDIKLSKKMKDETLIEKIIDALRLEFEAGVSGDEAEEDTETEVETAGKDDDLDIDDLI